MSAVAHFLKYYAGLEAAHTQTTADERMAVAKWATGKHRAVEIGVYEGVTTRVIAQSLARNAELYGVDPFFTGRLGICWSKPIARREVHLAQSTCRVEFVEKLSFDAAQEISGEFDFIFIDGDHSWEGIRQDWLDWSARVISYGIIALHDTRVPKHNPRVAEFGSRKYFDQHISHDTRFELVEQVDSLSVLRRLPIREGDAVN